jgi:alpha-L-fucosidase
MNYTKFLHIGMLSFGMLCTSTFMSCNDKSVDPPKPYGVLPSPDQLEWQKMEYYMFVHFGPNTFTDVEWGNGKEDPKVFNPTDVDCRQWAATAKAAGMKAIILTVKHHDGFCLWPSEYSTHTVRESPWKDGKGDVLKELSEACKEYGLKLGVYLSPWDQNHPAYGTPEYNQIFANTLSEVLGNYGPIFEQWFDGANGDANHGGKKQVYDWDLFHSTVYKLQPHAIIFSDIGPGCRWMGNERGVAGETNWSRLNIEGFGPGLDAPASDTLNIGNIHGAAWVPAETDVSIRPGWFYSPSTNDKVKSVDNLMDIYYTSIGRNSNLLLNVPPDRRGRIHPNDSTRLMEFRDAIEQDFRTDLTKIATVSASHTRGNSDKFAASNMLDDNYDSYWTTNDDQTSASFEISFGKDKSVSVNRMLLQEYIPLGQRISKFNVEVWTGDKWEEVASGTTIGYKRILRFPRVWTSKIRVNIQNSLACPILNKVSLFLASETLSAPVISRDKQGLVTIKCATPDPEIRYTVDGTEPSTSSLVYKGAFELASGGIIQARAFVGDGKEKSEIVKAEFDLAPAKWTVVSPKSESIDRVIDGTANAVGIADGTPLIVNLGEELVLKGFSFLPVNNTTTNNVYKYNLYVSTDGNNWSKVLDGALFNNIKNNPIKQEVKFNEVAKARFIKLEPLQTTASGDKYYVAEIGVITK